MNVLPIRPQWLKVTEDSWGLGRILVIGEKPETKFAQIILERVKTVSRIVKGVKINGIGKLVAIEICGNCELVDVKEEDRLT